MSTRPQLSGPIHAVAVDEADELLRENAKLIKRLEEARNELDRMQVSVSEFVNRLRPLHQMLDSFFGGTTGDSPASAPSGTPMPHNRDAWTAWKQQLPERCGRIIDALLVQPLTQTQMKTFCKMDQATVSRMVSILDRNGLVERDGRLVKLKRL